jgi:hypothetical protein
VNGSFFQVPFDLKMRGVAGAAADPVVGVVAVVPVVAVLVEPVGAGGIKGPWIAKSVWMSAP